MIYIELKELQKLASSRDHRAYITSDETWAFTEQPVTEMEKDTRRATPHELFNLFTADIIKANTVFIR